MGSYREKSTDVTPAGCVVPLQQVEQTVTVRPSGVSEAYLSPVRITLELASTLLTPELQLH